MLILKNKKIYTILIYFQIKNILKNYQPLHLKKFIPD